MTSLGIKPTVLTPGEAVHVTPSQRAIVHVPAGNEDVHLLSAYLTLIYPIDVEVSSDAKQVTIRGAQPDEICNAQNFALRFLGPESIMVLKVPFEIQVLCTTKTIRRYFAVRCRVIVTVKGNKALILRGPSEATRRLSTALSNLERSSETAQPANLPMAKKRAMQQLCRRLSIDYDQLQTVKPVLKSGLFDLLVEMEASISTAVMTAAGQGLPDTGLPTVDDSEEPAFVEVFRKPKDNDSKVRTNCPKPSELSHVPIAKPTRRLRPVIIDGANVAHADTAKPSFNAQNLRCALDYFLERGHEDILIVLHGIRHASCSAVFTEAEMAKYFSFASCRRLCKETLIADDDSIILEFATKRNAVVISNDQYRDWVNVRPEFRDVIENRLIPYSFNAGVFVISHHPMGKRKPPLDEILTFTD
uniref:Putative ribonuclease ZC3H12C n=2 Tax=Schistocephalus solidus TaxID=70667 RepID=A0A0X3P8N9_SCHSO